VTLGSFAFKAHTALIADGFLSSQVSDLRGLWPLNQCCGILCWKVQHP